MRVAIVGTLLLAVIPVGIKAQQVGADPSAWASFVGCWAPSPVDDAPRRSSSVTCVLPVTGDPLAAEFVSFEGGREVRASRITADGTLRDFSTASCQGRESARFSLDGERVFLRGEITCDGSTARQTSGVFSLTEAHRFLSVSGSEVPVTDDVRLSVLVPIPRDDAPPAVRARLASHGASPETTPRAPSYTMLTPSVVSEAAAALSGPVTEIWIAGVVADAPTAFRMDDEFARSLELAGVPTRVQSLLTALGDRAHWRVALSAAGAEVSPLDAQALQETRDDAEVRRIVTSISAVDGGRMDARFMASATNVPVGNACLGARVLTDGSFGVAGGAPAFANVLFARACPAIGMYDPRAMNGLLYGAYGGPGSQAVPAAPVAPRQAVGEADTPRPVPAVQERREVKSNSHPAPDPIPLGGLRTPPPAAPPAATRENPVSRTRVP
jgi:hypothetical protein